MQITFNINKQVFPQIRICQFQAFSFNCALLVALFFLLAHTWSWHLWMWFFHLIIFFFKWGIGHDTFGCDVELNWIRQIMHTRKVEIYANNHQFHVDNFYLSIFKILFLYLLWRFLILTFVVDVSVWPFSNFCDQYWMGEMYTCIVCSTAYLL